MAFLAAALLLHPTSDAAAQSPGNPRWVAYKAYGSSPHEACVDQWNNVGMNNGRSRFIGAFPRNGRWDMFDCPWTNFQWLCLAETPNATGGCGTLWGGYVRFECDSGYDKAFPGVCKPNIDYVPEGSPTTCTGAGPTPPPAVISPAVGNPIYLASGSKLLTAEDFATADGKFAIKRNYRSFPIGRTVNGRFFPLGSAKGWQFNFSMELQLGNFSGSLSSPNGYLTLVTPDGVGRDFALQSNGTFQRVASSGGPLHDYRVEFVGTLPSNLADIHTASTQWRVIAPDDTVWDLATFADFNGSIHRVARTTAITQRDGYLQTLTYANDGSLTTIVDSFSRTFTLTWSKFFMTSVPNVPGTAPYPEAISEIGLPDGTRLVYEYDPAPASSAPSSSKIERLVGVEHRDASNNVIDSTTYHYEDSRFSYGLTGVTDHRSVRVATYAYDSIGRAISTEGANGANRYEVAYSYSGSQRIREVTNPLGKVARYKFNVVPGSSFDIRFVGVDGVASTNCPASATAATYDGIGFIATTTDEEGRVTSYTRDARGRPTQIIEAFGTAAARTTTITWHSTYNVPASVVTPDLTTSYVWNSSGRLDSRTETDTTSHSVPYATNGQTRTWTYTYTTGGLVETVDGPLPGTGDTVSYTYDASGYVETYADELGHVTTVNAVNGRGQPTEIVDANGLVTAITYDDLARVVSTVADPTDVAATTAMEYDDAGNVTKVTQPDGAFLAMAYDGSSRVTSVTNNGGDTAAYTYDDMGNVTLVEISNGFPQLFFRWSQTFDELGRLIALTGVSTETWAYGYDKVGNLKSTADPNSNATAFGYDGLNRLVSFADERADVTSWTYGAQDEPQSTTDDRSVVTAYVRNGWGETIQEQSNDIGAVVYERDQNGKITERTDARSVVTEYAYDAAGRLISTVYPGETSSNVTYTYDSVSGGNFGVGRLTGVTDAAGTVAYTYDLLGRVTQELRVIGAQSYTVAYEYDAAGNIENVTYPSGRTIFYDRDSNGDISALRQRPAGGSQSWLVLWVGRTPFGPRSGIQFGNDMREWRRYDQAGRIVALETLQESTSTYHLDWTYAYGDKRNLTAINDYQNAANNESYGYTANGFLSSGSGPWGDLLFTYDGVGNRLSRTTDTGGGPITESYTIASGSNRMQSVATSGVTSRSFSHDAAGNITQDQDIFYSQTKALTWNHPGQIASVTQNSVPRGAYTYDYLHRMVVRNVVSGAGTMHRIHDLDGNVIAEYTGAGYLLTEYVWLEDRPIALVADAGTPTPQTLWVHTDHQERPALMTNASAAVVWRAKYLPFGEVTSLTGTAAMNYRFPGQWFQLEAGLTYNWHRHYDATTGRYVSPDPLGMPDGPSRYAYVLSSPLMYVDPTGEKISPWDLFKIALDMCFRAYNVLIGQPGPEPAPLDPPGIERPAPGPEPEPVPDPHKPAPKERDRPDGGPDKKRPPLPKPPTWPKLRR